MSVEIRNVEADDIVPWFRTMRTTFLMDATAPSESAQQFLRKNWGDPSRRFGAYERGRLVATLATFPTTISVPGGATTAVVAADALTMVTVAGTHRRRGLLTTMLTQSLTNARDRGEPLSILRAAEYPIYGRFGYAPASYAATFRVDLRRSPRLVVRSDGVTISHVEPADLIAPGQLVYDAVRSTDHGHIARDPEWQWARSLGLEGLEPEAGGVPHCLVAQDASGQPVGFLTWTPGNFDGPWYEADVPVRVHQFMASTADGYRALWEYLLGLDLVGQIELVERPVDDPIQYMLDDGRAAQPRRTFDTTWVRLLDVPGALSARTYACSDSLTLEVVDEDGGFASGTYVLDGGPDGGSCRSAPGATADLRLSQRALAGLYLSGRTVWSWQTAGLVDELRPGAAARLENMFAHARAPFNATPF